MSSVNAISKTLLTHLGADKGEKEKYRMVKHSLEYGLGMKKCLRSEEAKRSMKELPAVSTVGESCKVTFVSSLYKIAHCPV